MYYDCSPLTAVILRCAGSSSLMLFISIVCASLLLFVFGFESLSFLFFVDLACTYLAAISLLPFITRAHPGCSLVATCPLLFVRRLLSLQEPRRAARVDHQSSQVFGGVAGAAGRASLRRSVLGRDCVRGRSCSCFCIQQKGE